MIEFKGECGHLIRARDEDAGKVVRCSYCGREAVVARPPTDDEGENLLDAVEQTGVFDADATRAVRKSHKRRKRAEKRLAQGKSATVDPFAVILKMTYVAVIIVIGAVVWKYVPGLYQQLAGASPTPTPTAVAEATPPPAATPGPVHPTELTERRGLLTASLEIHPDGAYVASVPAGGLVLHLAEGGAVDAVFNRDDAQTDLRTNALLKLNPGRHTIAVAVRINDPLLMRMPGYPDLRRALESSDSTSESEKRLASWLLPDDDVTARTVRIGKYRYVARVYDVDVRGGWVGVTALFLPREPLGDLMTFLPTGRVYGFDTANVERELTFYRVPAEDRPLLLDALARVGRMAYRPAEDKPYRMFQIDPVDGAVTTDSLGF
ncbi:MAG TPA: hypothetical protein P5572_19075 [Phycisphaerae bacterium]|nr:hypothetical protein [Phycisphaerales bacterium]HRX87134.1 hypothetical protein [Phycisphaerae bacterium]